MNYIVKNPQTGQEVEINYMQQFCNGTWQVITEEHANRLLAQGADFKKTTVEQAREKLFSTGQISLGPDWYDNLGVKRAQVEKKADAYMRTLDCGCVVHSPLHIMQTSYQGTACPDCYDRIEGQGSYFVRERKLRGR